MRRSRQKQRKKKRVLWAGIVLLVIVVFSGCLAWNHLRHPLAILRPGLEGEGDWETEIAKNFDKDVINFLLLGFDRTAERDKEFQIYRPDTMLVASVNFRSGQVALLSIPRDSYVNIYGQNIYDKINSSYMYGHEYGIKGVSDPHLAGLTCTIKTVEDLLSGIPIHYYFTVDMDGVVEIIDELGGIYYDVEIPIKDTDGRLLVDKGYQKLDGYKYLQYCRYRGVGGDIGRAQRQQQLLIATFKQLKQAGKLVKLPQVYKSLTETVDTNLNLSQMAALALYGKEVDPDNIKSHVLAGSIQWAPRDGLNICYLVIDEKARVELIQEVFGVRVAERPQITLSGPPVQTEKSGQEQLPGGNLPEQPPFTGGGESPVPPEEPQPVWPEEPLEPVVPNPSAPGGDEDVEGPGEGDSYDNPDSDGVSDGGGGLG